LASIAPAVLGVYGASGASLWPGSVWDLDAFSPGWENQTPGVTAAVGLAGRNLLAISPPPATAATLVLDLARNMAIPVSDVDFLQVPADVVEVIIDYAQHLASFKMGGADFLDTMQLYGNFVIAAAGYNSRIRQLDFFNDLTRLPSQRQQAEQPRMDQPVLVKLPKNLPQPMQQQPQVSSNG
jgi:hypothetical protein